MDISESQLKIAALSHSTMETFICRSIPAPLENHRGRVPGSKAGQQGDRVQSPGPWSQFSSLGVGGTGGSCMWYGYV